MNIQITRAVPADAERICEIRDLAWIGAYANESLGITPEQIKINAQGLRGEFVPRRIAYLEKEIASEDGVQAVTYVAKDGDTVVGYVAPRISSGVRMISQIYLAPDYQRQGIGNRLLQTALNWLGNSADIYLEVVSYNEYAINFYKSFGFIKTDTIVEPDPDAPDFMVQLPETEMVLRAKPIV